MLLEVHRKLRLALHMTVVAHISGTSDSVETFLGQLRRASESHRKACRPFWKRDGIVMKFSRGDLVNILCCYVAFAEDEPSQNRLFVSEEKTSEMLVM
jgi:hypothetical protein